MTTTIQLRGRVAVLLRLALLAPWLLLATACGKDEQAQPGASAPAGADADADAEKKGGDDHEGEEGGDHAEGEEVRTENRVTLTPAGLATAGIAVELVRAEPLTAEGGGLDVPGQVEYDPSRVALISPRTAGRLERVLVVEGHRVGAGQVVAQITSPAFLAAQNELRQAARRAAALDGTADEQGARALVGAARQRLSLLGASAAEVARVERGGEPSLTLGIPAPFSGVIVEGEALEGAAVEAGTQLFKIADVSAVDVVAEVPERALPLLSIGQGASIAIAAYPQMRFAGRVERLHAELNPETRTVRAVIHVTNTGLVLRPGMFATVTLRVPLRAAAAAAGSGSPGATPTAMNVLTIPESAVVTDGAERYVFVEVGPRTYDRRRVTITSLAPPGSAGVETGAGQRVAVNSGLRAGERVVVRGAFTLKSELAKAGLGDHGH